MKILFLYESVKTLVITKCFSYRRYLVVFCSCLNDTGVSVYCPLLPLVSLILKLELNLKGLMLEFTWHLSGNS